MNYELALKLKEAGFKHETCCEQCDEDCLNYSLSELIEACEAYKGDNKVGDEFELRRNDDGKWSAQYQYWDIDSEMFMGFPEAKGSTPEEAVASLYLKLHDKLNTK